MSQSPNVVLVDPRAPRFGQGLTATLVGVGVLLAEPLLIGVVALVLGTAVATNWRADAYATIWRRVVVPMVGHPAEREPAAPHRFAKLVGAAFTVTATPLVLAGGAIATVGYGLAIVVSVLAAVGALTGFCLGCRLYQEVGFLRSLGVV